MSESSALKLPEAVPAQRAPIIIDMGKKKGKTIRAIKKGKGPVLDHVQEALDYTTQQLGPQAKDVVYLPVVLIYEKKPKKRKSLGAFW